MKSWKKTFKVAAILLAVLLVVGFVPTSVGATGNGGGGHHNDVKYYANYPGGSGEPTDNNDYDDGDWVTVKDPGTMSRTGYAFVGWDTDDDGHGTHYNPGDTFKIYNDVKLYAQWKKVYTVTYDKNAADATGSQTDSNNYFKDDTVTVLGPGTISRTGWTFQKWNTKKNGDGTDYAPGATFNIKGNTTLYAQWKQDKYTVTYAPGTHGTFAPQSTGNLVYNSDTPAFAGTPAGEAGWTFADWSPALADKVTGSVTYVAQWTADPQTYTVHYYLQGTATSVAPDKNGTGVTAQVVTESAVSVEGYTPVAPASQDLTLTAGTNEITFYYTADPQTYTVKYLEQGSNDVLSADKTGSGVTGQVVNESAIDITGYTLAGDASQSLTLTAGTNEIIFYYTANAQKYTVNFLEKGTGNPLAPSVTKDTFFNEVIDPACEIIPIPGYYYAGASVDSLTVGTDNDANVINLYYKGKKVPYVVEHLVHVTLFDQEFDLPIALPDSGIGRVGKTATGYAKDIPGYTATVESESITLAWGQPNIIKIYYTPNDQIYTVNYLEQGTNAPIIDPAIKSAKCGDLILPYSEYVNIPGYHIVDSEPWLVLWVGANDECNVINIYYERNAQAYTVNYLDKDTGDPIAPAKTGAGIFGDVITSADEVIDIDGYTYDSADVETLTLGADETANVINLYYASNTIVIPTTEPPLGPVETGTPTEEPTEGIVQVPDESVPAALPITGEASLDWMFLAGAIVLATGTLLLVFHKRKQGEK
jgi:uncharacterized repeat protein (TIGR02543 family)/LPXTG-motif cell wall-anchored protein